MAEIAAITSSPPALGDPHAAEPTPLPATLPGPSSPIPEPTEGATKSSQYDDNPLTGTIPSSPSAGDFPPAPQTPVQGPPPVPPKPVPTALIGESPASPPVDGAVPWSEEGTGKEAGVAPVQAGVAPVHTVKQESIEPSAVELLNATSDTPAQAPSEPSAQGEVQAASLSPGLTTSPNLYPSVHVTHNPNPFPDDAQFMASQPPAPAASNPTPSPPVSPQTITTTTRIALAVVEEDDPPPPQQAPNPESKTPIPSPNSDTPGGVWKTELPGSPSKAEHPGPTVPVINEPAPTFCMPTPTSRQAPDTMSYLESASLMSGTLESLSGLGEDGSSVGSDSEINGMTVKRIDKYGFLGGTQYSESSERELRVQVARQREMKWIDMFNNWDKWIKHRFPKVKLRCRKGIPSSLRARAWQLLSNSKDLLDANPGKFEELEREPGEAKWLDIIEKDLHRQFPFHEMFAARGGHGQQDLYRILKAYTIYRPEEGYCQAQAPVAAVLLMHMPAEQAFWLLVQICEKYLPGYYSAGLEAIQLDGEIFFSLLRRTCPMAYRHLKKFKIDPILYMTEWFMCVFSRTLPWVCVLRVWDMFFCEGVKIVFRVGLVLLKQMLGSVDKLRELQGMYETMERLRNISPESVREDLLVQEIVALPVTESLIERECGIQVRKWRESRGELTHQPARRLHGTRGIHEYKRRAASISSGGSFSFLGSSIPAPGPLRASSSLLSLPGFRRSKTPFLSQSKKGSFSGASGADGLPPHPPPAATSSRAPAPKPPMGPRSPASHAPSPLVASKVEPPPGPPPTSEAPPAQGQQPLPSTLAVSLTVSEQITPTIPSPTANNTPLPPCSTDAKKEAPPAAAVTPAASGGGAEEEDGKRKKRSKEDKKKKDDDKQKHKDKREKEKAEKERMRKEKERAEKEKERAEKEKKKDKGGKKKDKGGGEAGDKNGAAAAGAPKDWA